MATKRPQSIFYCRGRHTISSPLKLHRPRPPSYPTLFVRCVCCTLPSPMHQSPVLRGARVLASSTTLRSCSSPPELDDGHHPHDSQLTAIAPPSLPLLHPPSRRPVHFLSSLVSSHRSLGTCHLIIFVYPIRCISSHLLPNWPTSNRQAANSRPMSGR